MDQRGLRIAGASDVPEWAGKSMDKAAHEYKSNDETKNDCDSPFRKHEEVIYIHLEIPFWLGRRRQSWWLLIHTDPDLSMVIRDSLGGQKTQHNPKKAGYLSTICRSSSGDRGLSRTISGTKPCVGCHKQISPVTVSTRQHPSSTPDCSDTGPIASSYRPTGAALLPDAPITRTKSSVTVAVSRIVVVVFI